MESWIGTTRLSLFLMCCSEQITMSSSAPDKTPAKAVRELTREQINKIRWEGRLHYVRQLHEPDPDDPEQCVCGLGDSECRSEMAKLDAQLD